MYTSIDVFKAEWANESEATLKVLTNLTDESLSTKVYDEGRSLGFLAWHVAFTVPEMMSKCGLSFENFDENASPFAKAEDILNYYKTNAESLLNNISIWDDAKLLEDIDLYGQTFKHGQVLSMLIKHEIHHRAQMTVLMRQAGLKVPGIYGPSKEEWSAYGMPPQE